MQYAIHKTKVLYRINEPGWVQTFVTELDSALNSWLDEIPPYREWHFFLFIRPTIYTLLTHSLKSVGILIARIMISLTNPWCYMPIITSCKSPSTVLSSRHRRSRLLFRSRLLSYAQTLHDHAVILLIFSAVERLSLLWSMSVVSHIRCCGVN